MGLFCVSQFQTASTVKIPMSWFAQDLQSTNWFPVYCTAVARESFPKEIVNNYVFFFFRKKVPRCIFVRIKVYLTVYNATTTHQTEEDIETEKQQIKMNRVKN